MTPNTERTVQIEKGQCFKESGEGSVLLPSRTEDPNVSNARAQAPSPHLPWAFESQIPGSFRAPVSSSAQGSGGPQPVSACSGGGSSLSELQSCFLFLFKLLSFRW